MFNLARKKKIVPEAFKQEALLFNQTPEEQRTQKDAGALIKLMISPETLLLVMSAEDAYSQMVRQVSYWAFIDKFHPEYKKEIFPKAEEMAKQLSRDMINHPEKYPLPSKQKEGGGMGGMAANDQRTIKSFVLPNGCVMVKKAGKYSVNSGSENIIIEANNDIEALKKGFNQFIQN